jgi:hypothetical protein
MRPVLKRMEGHLKEKDGKNELSSLLIHVVYDLWNYHQLRFLPNALPPDINHRLVSISGDRVSINRFAFMNAHIYLSFPKSLFIDCHSHTLNNCGKKLDESCRYQFRFWERHLAVFARSSDTRHHWAEYAGTEMLEHNNTRWFKKRDVKEYIRNRWDAYVNFFREDVHGNVESDTSLYKLRKLLCEEYWDRNDAEAYALSKETYFLLRLELTVVCEASLIYYKACYNLEGKSKLNFIIINICSNYFSLKLMLMLFLNFISQLITIWGLHFLDCVTQQKFSHFFDYQFMSNVSSFKLFFYCKRNNFSICFFLEFNFRNLSNSNY